MAPDGSDQKSLQQFIKLSGSRKPMWRRKIGEKPLTDVASDQCLWRTWYISSLRAFRLPCDEWEGGGSAGKGAETDEGQTDAKNPSRWSASFVTWVSVCHCIARHHFVTASFACDVSSHLVTTPSFVLSLCCTDVLSVTSCHSRSKANAGRLNFLSPGVGKIWCEL